MRHHYPMQCRNRRPSGIEKWLNFPVFPQTARDRSLSVCEVSIVPKLPRLLVFIVAYQAETTIEKVVRRIPASLADDFGVEILAIDDGSKDRTFAGGTSIVLVARAVAMIGKLYIGDLE
jgi:hypothetical protein